MTKVVPYRLLLLLMLLLLLLLLFLWMLGCHVHLARRWCYNVLKRKKKNTYTNKQTDKQNVLAKYKTRTYTKAQNENVYLSVPSSILYVQLYFYVCVHGSLTDWLWVVVIFIFFSIIIFRFLTVWSCRFHLTHLKLFVYLLQLSLLLRFCYYCIQMLNRCSTCFKIK